MVGRKEKQRWEKMRGSEERREKSMRSSERNDDDAGGSRMKNNRYSRWTGERQMRRIME